MSDTPTPPGSLTRLVDVLGETGDPLRLPRPPTGLVDWIRSGDHAASTAATLLWQGAIRTRTFADALAKSGYNPALWPPDCLVVPHSTPNLYSLVVLVPPDARGWDPTYRPRDVAAGGVGEPRPLSFIVPRDELSNAVASALDRAPSTLPGGPIGMTNDIIGAAKGEYFSVVILPSPEMELTSAFDPALLVDLSIAQGGPVQGSLGSASVGILARRTGGNEVGVTTARHLFAKAGLGPMPGVTRAKVAGHSATVAGEDAMSDAAFLLPDDPNADFAALLPAPRYAGVLTGMTPRQNEAVRFAGCTSGAGTTVVRGWSPELPWTTPDMQMRVVTDLVTAPGDSGAALIDSSNKVCGLAFQASRWGVQPAISSWIWADSALSALGLEPVP